MRRGAGGVAGRGRQGRERLPSRPPRTSAPRGVSRQLRRRLAAQRRAEEGRGRGALLVDVPGDAPRAGRRPPVDGAPRQRRGPRGEARGKSQSTPRLEGVEGVRLRGTLVEAVETATRAAWPGSPRAARRPSRSATGSPAASSSRIRRRPRRSRRPRPSRPGGWPCSGAGGARRAWHPIINALGRQRGQPPSPTRRRRRGTTAPLAIHLWTGDVIPSEVARIDEQGVTPSPSRPAPSSRTRRSRPSSCPATSRCAPPQQVQRERLLTLPRTRGSPTHLVRSPQRRPPAAGQAGRWTAEAPGRGPPRDEGGPATGSA